MAEFGLVDEGVPYTPLSTVQSDDQAIEQPTSSPATQDVREFIKPVQAVETRTSWIIPGKTDEPAHAMDSNPDPTVEPSADEPESPAEPVEPLHPAPSTGQGDWDEAFTPDNYTGDWMAVDNAGHYREHREDLERWRAFQG